MVMRPPDTLQRGGEVDLLRSVYVEGIVGRATVEAVAARLGATRSGVRAALREAERKKLLKVEKGSAALTPAGRRRLRVVMLGGAFEIIHPGHIVALSEAKEIGNTLVVVVATDENVEKNKGRPPVTNQSLRVGLVSSLRQVDLAMAGNKGSIYDILLKVRPDVVALGYDQRHSGEEIVKEAARRGIQISTARLGTHIPDVKTSKILFST